MNILSTVTCGSLNIDVSIPNTVSTIMRVIFIAVPVILIFLGMVDFFKAFIASEESKMKEAQKAFINRVIIALIIFLFPSIVNLSMGVLLKENSSLECVPCFINGCDGTTSFGNSSDDDNSTNISVSSVELKTSSNSVQVGETIQLTTNIEPSNATNQAVTYKSEDESVLTVTKSGKVTGVSEGNTNVTVETQDGKKSMVTLFVTSDGTKVESSDIPVDSLEYDEDAYDMVIDTEEVITPIVSPSNADLSSVTYESSKPGVATVTDTGKVIALEEGQTTITATSGDISDSIEINVMTEELVIPVESITMESAFSMQVNETKQLNAVIKPSDATNQTITYSTDNSDIVYVDQNGNVTAIKEGTANVYAVTEDGNKQALSIVTVTQATIPVTNLKLTEKKTTISIGGTYKIKPVIEPSKATNKNVSYTSSDSKIATVSADGTITGKKAGTATITVKTVDGNKTAKIKVTVSESHRIHFLKTGQSDCILLESNGNFGLIDTSTRANRIYIKNYLKSLNINKLDFIILTHQHSDHYGSLGYLLNEFKPKKLYLKVYYGRDLKGDGTYDKENNKNRLTVYKNNIQLATNNGTKIVYVDKKKDGYSIKLNDMKVYFYNTKNRFEEGSSYIMKTSENVNSLINLVEVNKLKTVLGGDLSSDELANPIAQKIGKVDVYKLDHHGLYNGTSQIEADNYKANYAIVTNSKKDFQNSSTIAIDNVKKYTKKIYYSGDGEVIVDYSSGKVKVKQNK